MTKQEVIQLLKKKQAGQSVAALATVIGVSASYLYDVLNGAREPGRTILSYLGLSVTKKTIRNYAKLRR